MFIISNIDVIPKTLSSFKWESLWHISTVSLLMVLQCLCFVFLTIFKPLAFVLSTTPIAWTNPQCLTQSSTHCTLATEQNNVLIWMVRERRIYTLGCRTDFDVHPATSILLAVWPWPGFCKLVKWRIKPASRRWDWTGWSYKGLAQRLGTHIQILSTMSSSVWKVNGLLLWSMYHRDAWLGMPKGVKFTKVMATEHVTTKARSWICEEFQQILYQPNWFGRRGWPWSEFANVSSLLAFSGSV